MIYKKINKNVCLFFLVIILISLVTAADYTPQGDINLRGIYAIKNATNITANYFCNSTNCYTVLQYLADNNTLYYAGGTYIYLNSSNAFFLNETKLNATIDSKVNATNYLADGVYIYLSGVTFTLNETKLNSTINVIIPDNLSQFVDDLGNRGYTSLSNFTNDLGFYNNSKINTSELENQGDGKLGILDSFINLLIDNRITQAFIKALGFYDNTEVYNKTEINNFNNSWSTTYNSTYAGYISFNHTSFISNLTNNDCGAGYLVIGVQPNGTVFCSEDQVGAPGAGDIESVQGDDLYIYNGSNSGPVTLLFNETKLNEMIRNTGLSAGFNSTYNETYHNYVTANQSNSTTWWAGISGFLTTYLFKNGNNLDLNETKLNQTILLRAAIYNETGIINSVNTTVNIQALGFYNKSQIDSNLTLYLLLTDQRFNETSLINSINTTINIQNLGFYNKSQIDSNLSLYLLLTDQRYNETSLANSINTSANIQALGFYTKSQVDNNLSLYLLLTDQRFNETAIINSVNTTINIQNLGFYNKTQIDNNFSLYLLLTDQRYNESGTIQAMNASWLSTYNITYSTTTLEWNGNKSALIGCINNASYLSTYNSTYSSTTGEWNGNKTALLGCVNNASYLSTYNSTYATTTAEWNGNKSALLGTINNASYLSTFNTTYDVHVNNATLHNQTMVYNHTLSVWNLWGQWFYNMTIPAITDINNRFWNRTQTYNKSDIDTQIITNGSYFSTYNDTYAGCINNASYLSTYNSTYAGTTSAWNGNSSALLGCINNASYLSTYNSTYNTWAYNQTYSGSTYNATYASTTSEWNGNKSALIGTINNASYLSTYNSTYNTILNQQCPAGNYTYQIQTNGTILCRSDVSGAASETDPIWSANFTNMQTDCANGNYSYGINGNGTLKCRSDVSGTASMDYTNLALTNVSETWDAGQNVSMGAGGWFKGMFNWVLGTINGYLYGSFNGTTLNLNFNETKLNLTISNLGVNVGFNSTYNETYAGCVNNASYLSTYNSTYAGTTSEWNGNKSAVEGCVNNASYLSTYNDTYNSFVTANVSNSTTWWASVSGFLTTYLFKNGNNLDLNETKLNSTISNLGVSIGFNSTYNATYQGCVNNASYLSTYNATYATKADYQFTTNNFNGTGNWSSTGRLCLDGNGCTKYIWYNGSNVIIYG